jgi:hypothetical protein
LQDAGRLGRRDRAGASGEAPTASDASASVHGASPKAPATTFDDTGISLDLDAPR